MAYGVVFSDGHVALRWVSSHPATSTWSSLNDLVAVHGHDNATMVQWIDDGSDALEDLAVQSSQRPRRARRDQWASPADEESEAPSADAAPSMNGAAPAASEVPLAETEPLPKTELPRQLKPAVSAERPEPESAARAEHSPETDALPEAEPTVRSRGERRSGRHRRASQPIDFDMVERSTEHDAE